MAYTAYPDYVDQPGQLSAINAAGVDHYWQSGKIHVSDLDAAKFVIDHYNPLLHLQQKAISAVKKQLASMIAAGFPYKGVLIAIDPTSLQNINMQSMVASNVQAGLITAPWKSSTVWLPQGSGPSLPLSTPSAMMTFHATVANYVSDLTMHADNLEREITSATTPAAVEAINVTTGWPTS